MSNIAILLILIVSTAANAVVIGNQEHKKLFSVPANVDSHIDSLVGLMDEYLSKPMNWCEVVPTGFGGTQPIGGARYKGYVQVNIELEITCDNHKLMDVMESIFGDAYEYNSSHMKPVGIMWDGYNSMQFSKAIRNRFPGIRYMWVQSATEAFASIDQDYAAEQQGSPILGKLMVNGTVLSDDYITDHKYGNEGASADMFRLSVGDGCLFRIAVESPKVMNAKQLNQEYRDVRKYSASVSYMMREDNANRILADKNIDVTVERIYNHKTPGWYNRTYKFLGYLN